MSQKVIDIASRSSLAVTRDKEPSCFCANSLGQVESAWQLVYRRYARMQLIDENPYRIHAVPRAVGDHACVIWGPEGSEVGYTMTLFRDNSMGLALDSVYGDELDGLRYNGRHLLEVGMLADRRECASRSIKTLFSMMRWAIYYGLHTGVTDIVIGVHPRHAGFYKRCYGFEKFAAETSYPMVKNNPVVPLRLRLRESLAKDVLPRGLAHARAHPLPASVFADRFTFAPELLHGSRLVDYLIAQHDTDPTLAEAAPRAMSLSQLEPWFKPSRPATPYRISVAWAGA